MKRIKCTEMTHKLGNCVKQETIQKLQKFKYSIIVDETADFSRPTQKSCGFLAQYFDFDIKSIKTSVIDLIDIYYGVESAGNTIGLSGENLTE